MEDKLSDDNMKAGSSSSSDEAHAACLHFKNEKFVDLAKSLQLTEKEKANRREVVDSLHLVLKQRWPKCELLEYGSMVSTFALHESDIDVSLFIGGLSTLREGDIVWTMNMDDSHVSDGQVVNRIGEILLENGIKNKVISGARVPIVKFEDPKHCIHVDISVGKFNGYMSSRYLYDLQSLDPRVSQFVLIVKHWAKARGINSSYGGTLSSYSYCLMCINFLQTRDPPILPILQRECMSRTFAVFEKDTVQGYFDDMNVFEYFPERNVESLSELLDAFFCYWADKYDYRKDVISTRTGSTLTRAEKNWSTEEGIAIEDPFETERNISSSVFALPTIRDELNRAKWIMSEENEDGEPWKELIE